MDDSQAELDEILGRLRKQHDVVPFLETWHSPSEMELRLFDSGMLAILQASPDWLPPAVGDGPVWLQLEADDRHGQLVIYRATADHNIYALTPSSGDKLGT